MKSNGGMSDKTYFDLGFALIFNLIIGQLNGADIGDPGEKHLLTL